MDKFVNTLAAVHGYDTVVNYFTVMLVVVLIGWPIGCGLMDKLSNWEAGGAFKVLGVLGFMAGLVAVSLMDEETLVQYTFFIIPAMFVLCLLMIIGLGKKQDGDA